MPLDVNNADSWAWNLLGAGASSFDPSYLQWFADDYNAKEGNSQPPPSDPVQPPVPDYSNPYWGPLPPPGNVGFGDPGSKIDTNYGTDVIGQSGPGGLFGNPWNDLPPVGDTGTTNPAHGSLGLDNPTVYNGGGNGGLFGSGIDIGLPGIVSVGGLLGGSGGLFGLGGDMGGVFGGGSTSSGSGAPPPANEAPNTVTTIPVFGGNNPDGPNNEPPPLPDDNTPLTVTGGPYNDGSTNVTNNGPQGPSSPVTLPPIVPVGNNNPPPPTSDPVQNPPPITLPPPVGPGTAPSTPGETTPPPVTLPPPIGSQGNSHGPYIPSETPTTPPITVPPITGNVTPGETVKPPVTLPPVVTPPPVITPPPSTTTTTPPPMSDSLTMPALPLDRNYYKEGNQTNQDLSSLLAGIFGNYANYAGKYGATDLSNYGSLLSGLGGYNSQLTGMANNQTSASNTALRAGNVSDAGNLGGSALSILQQLNPNLYSSLNQANGMAGNTGQPSDIQTTLESQARQGLALGTQLDPQDQRQAQQAAREAWSARGLVNSNGAVGDEILNTYNLGQQRQAQRQGLAQQVDATGFNQRQQGFGNALQNAQLQSQNAFNPFQTITSANTQNQGLNQSLFGNAAGFSSGAFGNQNVNNMVNPFNPYSQDVYNSNFNAANARYISAGNNAAAAAGANSAASGQIANSFLNLIGSLYGTHS